MKTAQETNKRLGYGDRGKEWDKKSYNVTLNKIRSYERTKKENEEYHESRWRHKGFKAVILTSAGIGKQYTENKHKTSKNKYQEDKTDETYRLPNGAKSALPIYYRNKIYTDEEKEKLWLNKLDKQERYVNGTKISVKKFKL